MHACVRQRRCKCVCVQHRGGREGTAGQRRQREKDGRSRQACHRFQRDAPSTRPTDGWRPCSKASWRERELTETTFASLACPAHKRHIEMDWMDRSVTERENEKENGRHRLEGSTYGILLVFCSQNAWPLLSDGYHGYNYNKFCFPTVSRQADEDQRYFNL